MEWYIEERQVKGLVFKLSILLLQLNGLKNDYIEAYYSLSENGLGSFTIGLDYRKLYVRKSFPPKYPVTIFMRYIKNSGKLGKNVVGLFFVAMFLPDFMEIIDREEVIEKLRDKWMHDEDIIILGEEHIRELENYDVYKELELGLRTIYASNIPNAYMWTWNTLKDVSIGTIIDVTNKSVSQIVRQARKEILKVKKIQDVMAEIYGAESGEEAIVIEKDHLVKYKINNWIITYFREI